MKIQKKDKNYYYIFLGMIIICFLSLTKSNNTKTIEVFSADKNICILDFQKPIEGKIVKDISMDKLIYSKTLNTYRIHDGVDLDGKIGDNVYSIEKGIVESIYDDSFYGKTIIIDHGEGYRSIYSNIDPLVKEKDIVIKDTKIAKIANNAIGEIKEKSHLHFSMTLNNKIIDPKIEIDFEN